MSTNDSLNAIRRNFHKLLRDEVFLTSFRGSNRNKENLVDDVLMYNSVVCEKNEDGVYKIKDPASLLRALVNTLIG